MLCDPGLDGEEGGLVELEGGWVVVDVGGGVGRDGEGDVDVVDLVVEVGLGCPQRYSLSGHGFFVARAEPDVFRVHAFG